MSKIKTYLDDLEKRKILLLGSAWETSDWKKLIEMVRSFQGQRNKIIEKAAFLADKVLTEEAYAFDDIRNSYIEARTTGKHAGRNIPDKLAAQYAHDFHNRSDALWNIKDHVEKAILSLKDE